MAFNHLGNMYSLPSQESVMRGFASHHRFLTLNSVYIIACISRFCRLKTLHIAALGQLVYVIIDTIATNYRLKVLAYYY